MLLITFIATRYHINKLHVQRRAVSAQAKDSFMYLINKDVRSLHITSDTIMMLVRFGKIRSVGVVKLVAVMEQLCCAIPPFVSLTDTWKS